MEASDYNTQALGFFRGPVDELCANARLDVEVESLFISVLNPGTKTLNLYVRAVADPGTDCAVVCKSPARIQEIKCRTFDKISISIDPSECEIHFVFSHKVVLAELQFLAEDAEELKLLVHSIRIVGPVDRRFRPFSASSIRTAAAESAQRFTFEKDLVLADAGIKLKSLLAEPSVGIDPRVYEVLGLLRGTNLSSMASSDMLGLLNLFPSKCENLQNSFLVVLGALIHSVLLKRGWISTAWLKPFSAWLDSRSAIESLVDVVNEFENRVTSTPRIFVISKHTLNPSWLLMNKDKHLASLKAVLDVFAEKSLPAMICYGTLLGAARNGDFIPHDDDVDMLYSDGSASREESIKNRDILAEEFRSKGFSVNIGPGEYNMHVTYRGGTIDIFPCWKEGEEIHLLMEDYKFRYIAASLLLPVSEIQLLHEKFPAPSMVSGFLSERYGPAWMTPNKFFEWPWTLSDS